MLRGIIHKGKRFIVEECRGVY